MKTIFIIYHLFIASKLKCIQHSTWNATKLGRIYQLNKKTYRTKKTSDITLQIKRLHTIQRQKEGHQPDNFSFLFLNILLILYKFRIKSSKVSPPGSKNLPFICCFDFATASTVTLEINIIISSTESLSIRYYLLHLYSQLAFVS